MAGLAVEVTKRVLFDYGPSILREEYYDGAKKPPGNLPRLQASAGPHKSGDDPHIAGRALDIVLRNSFPFELALGNQLVDVFLQLRESMKWISVVYNHSEWNGAGYKMPRRRFITDSDGKPTKIDDVIFGHITHIHIEWSVSGLASGDFEEDLVGALVVLKTSSLTENLYGALSGFF